MVSERERKSVFRHKILTGPIFELRGFYYHHYQLFLFGREKYSSMKSSSGANVPRQQRAVSVMAAQPVVG